MGAALEGLLARRERAVLDDDSTRAAVLLVLYDEGDRPYLVLTKRTETVAHPGQISLPGGRLEPDDPSLRAAAVRETEEEIGVPAAALRVVGALDDVHTMASNYAITPFVAVLEGPFAATPADDEVALVLEVPVEDLLEADARLPEDVDGLALRYPLADEDVWGATARILRNFSRLARCALGPADLSRSGPPPGR
jgi:8-oxo-dGTP pyrophosphatase MutT (NUDIX family)